MDEESQGGSLGHTPVLLEEVLERLDPRPGDIVLDATVGAGGHSRAIAERIGPSGRLIGLDADPKALEIARATLADVAPKVDLIHANFSDVEEILITLGVPGVAVALADLGVSSMQLDAGERGFSFRFDAPLDMRMDPRLQVTASDLVNRLSEKELGNVFYYNAQEHDARRIASAIYEQRRSGRINTTAKLAEVVCRALHVNPDSRRSKIHPATRTFLALRMAVNQEVASLERFLEAAPQFLQPGGRIGVISFHSVEDKVVKLDFRKRANEGLYRIVTKKPIVASDMERGSNPRSRSAKLRVAIRTLDDCAEE
jgi:16S rRNA (cytosine1402-N4)-methyltransferase